MPKVTNCAGVRTTANYSRLPAGGQLPLLQGNGKTGRQSQQVRFGKSKSQRKGSSLSHSSREPKYKIEFHSEDSPYHPDDDQESVVMPDKNGRNFLCFLPKVEQTRSGKSVPQHNMSSMILETEKQVKLKTPDELLEVLKDQCFIRQEGWWSYEFCYQKKLRQLHLEDDKIVQEFVLGVYDAEATAAFNQNLSDISTLKDPRSKDASQRYHAHQYTNGTICDLTNQPRETEVRFVCSEPRAMISSITELSTCKYALTVQTPTLCKHSLFQEERPVWHTIDCNVLPKDYKEEIKVDKTPIVMVTEDEYPSNDKTEE
ncbi:hypothetical protein Dsin_017772 [Dipteronia sinensis]|uniref:Protein OS-9 homolog n=1 Tax=Dipteronia sinensis TaxID=43782 RepID=A0AAE0E6R7_9ROSI|nr:hypothetical protein Dsin_017772 [Dipteronia sinensis]